jgi:hypothetical protein
MNTKFFVVLASLMVVGMAASAHASETYPGMMCESGCSVDSYGHCENQTSSTLTVLCPIIANPTATPPTNAKIWVTDYNSSSDVCCRSVVKNVNQVVYGEWDCSSGSTSGYQTLQPVVPSYNYTYTHRYYECQIPAKSGNNVSEIRSYRY